jgi:lipopolysaccharide/colanic/teichoic acid biosynthesis glycosyltransferase
MRRLTRSLSRITPPAGHRSIVSPRQFQAEIDKEIHRADRRGLNPEFALILLDFNDHKVKDQQLNFLVDAFQERLRVSDTLGWHEMKLAILLPETDRRGALLVSDSLVELAKTSNIEMEATVSIYPWDDRLNGASTRPAHEPFDDRINHGVASEGSEESLEGGSEPMLFDGGAATATLAPPKIVVAPKPRSAFTGGTGEKILFAQSLETPKWKRAIDMAGAGLGLVFLSPFLLGAAIAIKVSSKGPVLFRQKREGKDGNHFHIYKFRTMCADAEARKDGLRVFSEQDGPAFKLADDPRITKVGKYLRKSCIDELPQLLNVLAGDMSIVGPRPLPVNESQQCEAWQRQRLTVLPGLTCIWQARGGRDVKFADWMRMDLEYIEQRGFWNDMRLIGETAKVVIMHKGSV